MGRDLLKSSNIVVSYGKKLELRRKLFFMTTDKLQVQHLVEICKRKGMKHVIISPGSRNAPLVIAFNREPEINCLSIVDERSAAFFALGIAQQTGKPVGIISTSGTAVLNYAPAIAEAYYQNIPLVAITADRPNEWIDQSVGQSIKQNNIYANYIKKSIELPVEPKSDNELWYSDRLVNEAINNAINGKRGPVHINIPFREPLYNLEVKSNAKVKITEIAQVVSTLDDIDLEPFVLKWKEYKKRIILTGMLSPNKNLNNILNTIAKDENTVVLTETISNLFGGHFIPCIDKVISSFSNDDKANFKPDLLITIGNSVVSKMVKAFLQNNKAIEHWHIDENSEMPDTYQSLTDVIPLLPEVFFSQIAREIKPLQGNYRNLWKQRESNCEDLHDNYLNDTNFCDLKVYEKLLSSIPENSNLQLGNSTVVRYAQLFKPVTRYVYNSNRGTSGIDGCTSTAAGAAYSNNKPTTIITGDISFLYDSNALWNNYLSPNLRIIVINNSGGGIFRFLDGSSSIDESEQFFATPHNTDIEKITTAHNIPHFVCNSLASLDSVLDSFYLPADNTAVLEIKTPAEESANVLKEYFKMLTKFER